MLTRGRLSHKAARRPTRPAPEPFVRAVGCAGRRRHERLGRGGLGLRQLRAARGGGGHDVVVPLAVSSVGGAGGRVLRHLRPLQLRHRPPSEHRGRCVDDHQRLHPAALRGALLLLLRRVRQHGGRQGGPAALLAEGCLLLRDGCRPHRHQPDPDHAAGQRHGLRHRSAVRTLRPGQKGGRHFLRPDPAAEAAGGRGEAGGDPGGGAVTRLWVRPGAPCERARGRACSGTEGGPHQLPCPPPAWTPAACPSPQVGVSRPRAGAEVPGRGLRGPWPAARRWGHKLQETWAAGLPAPGSLAWLGAGLGWASRLPQRAGSWSPADSLGGVSPATRVLSQSVPPLG